MKVSVIIPLYNKAAFVKEAIESVLDQEFKTIEVIVVDDASTDGSLHIVENIEDERIRIFRNEQNQGAALCAQRAIDEAVGEYLIRLDADDLCVPGRIKKQVAFMDANPEVGASGGFLQLFGNRDKLWRFPEKHNDCMAQMLFSVPVSQGASILRHSVIKEYGIRYTEDLPAVGEDWLYWLQWSKVSRFANLQEALTLYRRGEHNASFGRDRYADHKRLFERVFSYYDIPISNERIDLHFYSMKIFRTEPTAESVKAYRRHLHDLVKMNAKRNIFPEKSFVERLERSWNELFYYLPPFGHKVVASYRALSGGLSKNESKYYFRYRVNRILGRV